MLFGSALARGGAEMEPREFVVKVLTGSMPANPSFTTEKAPDANPTQMCLPKLTVLTEDLNMYLGKTLQVSFQNLCLSADISKKKINHFL